MTALPEPDPMRNRELIAERLGWPEDGLAACLTLEADFPRWMVYWTKGDLPASPRRGYTARHGQVEVFGETPDELRTALADADAELESRRWPSPWS